MGKGDKRGWLQGTACGWVQGRSVGSNSSLQIFIIISSSPVINILYSTLHCTFSSKVFILNCMKKMKCSDSNFSHLQMLYGMPECDQFNHARQLFWNPWRSHRWILIAMVVCLVVYGTNERFNGVHSQIIQYRKLFIVPSETIISAHTYSSCKFKLMLANLFA